MHCRLVSNGDSCIINLELLNPHGCLYIYTVLEDILQPPTSASASETMISIRPGPTRIGGGGKSFPLFLDKLPI